MAIIPTRREAEVGGFQLQKDLAKGTGTYLKN
jgi:hypothetical protein